MMLLDARAWRFRLCNLVIGCARAFGISLLKDDFNFIRKRAFLGESFYSTYIMQEG